MKRSDTLHFQLLNYITRKENLNVSVVFVFLGPYKKHPFLNLLVFLTSLQTRYLEQKVQNPWNHFVIFLTYGKLPPLCLEC